uniref:Transmembrane protein n=1 Tax=Cacopsylla melanoneura TaxID=428564 RepID=A0A8D9AWQ6_9HEMI
MGHMVKPCPENSDIDDRYLVGTAPFAHPPTTKKPTTPPTTKKPTTRQKISTKKAPKSDRSLNMTTHCSILPRRYPISVLPVLLLLFSFSILSSPFYNFFSFSLPFCNTSFSLYYFLPSLILVFFSLAFLRTLYLTLPVPLFSLFSLLLLGSLCASCCLSLRSFFSVLIPFGNIINFFFLSPFSFFCVFFILKIFALSSPFCVSISFNFNFFFVLSLLVMIRTIFRSTVTESAS